MCVVPYNGRFKYTKINQSYPNGPHYSHMTSYILLLKWVFTNPTRSPLCAVPCVSSILAAQCTADISGCALFYLAAFAATTALLIVLYTLGSIYILVVQ